MNIIVFTKRGKRHQVDLGQFSARMLFGLVVSIGVGIFVAVGFFAGNFYSLLAPALSVSELRQELAEQKAQVAGVREEAESSIDALSIRLAELNAHVIRLDALGERLTTMAGLEEGEFNFTSPPAQGGPEIIEDGSIVPAINFVRTLETLSLQIEDRERQLAVLENLIINRNLQNKVQPAGRPIKSGWLSSYFGVRTDPFTGKLARHYGVDFAGKFGSEIYAVGAGVVTWAGPRYGYGQMVEINHGNGYATRYAHNSKIMMNVGDTVKKGQVIARMGESGRATAPHVHFEVLYNGKVVNPLNFIKP
ncbi:MAG: M23 family metallopeptidase [Gammaproteobacteria bacterium]